MAWFHSVWFNSLFEKKAGKTTEENCNGKYLEGKRPAGKIPSTEKTGGEKKPSGVKSVEKKTNKQPLFQLAPYNTESKKLKFLSFSVQ